MRYHFVLFVFLILSTNNSFIQQKSIMIGTALSQKEQADILKKLDKADDPWSCAHGRPTMSHIRSLEQILLEDNEIIIPGISSVEKRAVA